MKTEVKLRIADTVILLQSVFPLQDNDQADGDMRIPERFNNFICKDSFKKADIIIKVLIVDSLPKYKHDRVIFTTCHPDDQRKNWRLAKKGNNYIYWSFPENKQQVMLINSSFDQVTAYLLPKEGKEKAWDIADIIYDFLQVLLIHNFALRKIGVFVHSCGVKDIDGRGLLFAGKSGAGKSTKAKLWSKHSRAMVLNDDRIIVRRLNGKFVVYGSPWHGVLSDYLYSRMESAPLDKLFFLYHAPLNTAKLVSGKKAFNLLYPAIFATFWEKRSLENIASFLADLVENVPCFRLGFVNDKRVIAFTRNI